MNKFGKILCIGGAVSGTAYVVYRRCKKKNYEKIIQLTKEKDKWNQMFRFMDNWMNQKINGNKIEDYLLKRNCRNIAIYGMSYIGQTLINELEGSAIHIKYGIDRDSEVYWETFPVVKPQEVTENVDAIIVTALSFFNEVKNTLQDRINCPIISLEEIVDSQE